MCQNHTVMEVPEQLDQHQVLYTVWYIHCLHMGIHTHFIHAEEAHKLSTALVVIQAKHVFT